MERLNLGGDKSVYKILNYLLCKIPLLLFLVALFFSVITYLDIATYNNLIAAQWCKKDNALSYASNPYYGVYIYMKNTGDGTVSVEGYVYDSKIKNIWQPYRIYGTGTLAKGLDRHTAVREWSSLSCKQRGTVEIGSSRQVFVHQYHY